MKIEYETSLLLADGPQRVVWLDIETKKVDAPWRRWAPFMVGAAHFNGGTFCLQVITGTETEICDWLVTNFKAFEIRYSATREFDEMVLRGRFTNARRAHRIEPGPWPNIDREEFIWRNRRKVLKPEAIERAPDLPSKDVPAAWAAGRSKIVVLHCAKDVGALVARDPDLVLNAELTAYLEGLLSETAQ